MAEKLVLEYDAWEKATEPILCDWCSQRISLGDSYWSVLFVLGGTLYKWMRVCPECASVGPPLEEVLP